MADHDRAVIPALSRVRWTRGMSCCASSDSGREQALVAKMQRIHGPSGWERLPKFGTGALGHYRGHFLLHIASSAAKVLTMHRRHKEQFCHAVYGMVHGNPHISAKIKLRTVVSWSFATLLRSRPVLRSDAISCCSNPAEPLNRGHDTK